MAKAQVGWTDFGWQGIRLRVPEDWNLGRVDGSPQSGYVRLDDAEIVRVEIEWRTPRSRTHEPVEGLIDRYLYGLQKRAKKAGVTFAVQRRAKFLKNTRWLEGREYETFTWKADFHAFNLALKASGGRIVLVRVLSLPGEDLGETIEQLLGSLEDRAADERWLWSVYGLRFSMPADFKLESHELKSGHIQLSFEKGKQLCRVQRLSMAQLLLKGQELLHWYPVFFKKQLRDVQVEVAAEDVKGHLGLRVTGTPRSRWRQLLRPLPWVNPRPRVYLDGRAWHCEQTNKICLVDYLFRKKERLENFPECIIDGYLCHEETTQEEDNRKDGHQEEGG